MSFVTVLHGALLARTVDAALAAEGRPVTDKAPVRDLAVHAGVLTGRVTFGPYPNMVNADGVLLYAGDSTPDLVPLDGNLGLYAGAAFDFTFGFAVA